MVCTVRSVDCFLKSNWRTSTRNTQHHALSRLSRGGPPQAWIKWIGMNMTGFQSVISSWWHTGTRGCKRHSWGGFKPSISRWGRQGINRQYTAAGDKLGSQSQPGAATARCLCRPRPPAWPGRADFGKPSEAQICFFMGKQLSDQSCHNVSVNGCWSVVVVKGGTSVQQLYCHAETMFRGLVQGNCLGCFLTMLCISGEPRGTVC